MGRVQRALDRLVTALLRPPQLVTMEEYAEVAPRPLTITDFGKHINVGDGRGYIVGSTDLSELEEPFLFSVRRVDHDWIMVDPETLQPLETGVALKPREMEALRMAQGPAKKRRAEYARGERSRAFREHLGAEVFSD